MARVFIPSQWRDLTDSQEEVAIDGASLDQVIAGLEARFPGIRQRVCTEGTIAPGLAVSVDGKIASRGMRTGVAPDSEVHFLPAIGGG